MAEPAMNGELILERFQPFQTIPAEQLPPAWRPGSVDPQFTNGLPLNQLGLASPLHAITGRLATYHATTGVRFATGFVIHPRIVLTAAHVLYNTGVWRDIVVFQPAFNNGHPCRNFEKMPVKKAYVPSRYFSASPLGFDYAVLVLEQALPIELGGYGFKHLTEDLPFPLNGGLIGYPTTHGFAKQITNEGALTRVDDDCLLANTITVSQGFSGGAIITKFPGEPVFAVGIHNKTGVASLASPAMMTQINHVKNNLNT